MPIIEQIKAHEQEILSGNVPDDLQQCPQCKGRPQCFKPHDVRSRLFLVIIENFVNPIRSFLGRWRCPLCGCRFTYYPDFTIPYKRYVKDNIIQLSQRYLQEDTTPYRKVVQDNGSAIGYRGIDKIDERQLVGSTVWRWLSSIGALKGILCTGLNLIRQKSPSSEVFREIRPIAQWKYRSENRKKLLNCCIRFFAAEQEHRALFGCSLFPRFATGLS